MSTASYTKSHELSITSSDPNVRKLARKLRIQRRLDALHKETRIEDEEVIERSLTERQILDSNDNLEKLIAEGDEVVSSVKVANDAREIQRRREAQDIRETLLIKLEEDDKECMEKYHEINKKWSLILDSKDPLDIHARMASQNSKCLEIFEQKDKIIAELKQELENADLKFVDDLKKQNEDIDILIERMDNQLKTMVKAYCEELKIIDDVIDSERKVLLEELTEQWDTLYKKLQDDSREGIEKRKEAILEYEKEMKKVMTEHQEEFRAQSINLELENQNLLQEAQNLKALCTLNVEKLNYNYAILKQREDENAIVKNQQKRRINKLQDTVNSLKKTYTSLEESTRLEIQKLTDQILKAHENILEIEEKSDHFTEINDKKYLKIWDMNVKYANELIDKILTTDKMIYEQVLGISWQPPDKSLLVKDDLPSYYDAMCVIQKEKNVAEEKKKFINSYKKATSLEDINLERRLLNCIITNISERSGYLIEDNLRDLLLPYTSSDNIVIRLDNVFQALSITSKEDVELLLHFFLPYTYCPTCTVTGKNSFSVPDQVYGSVETSDSKTTENSEELSKKAATLVAIVKEEVQLLDICVNADYTDDSSQICNISTDTSTPCATESEISPIDIDDVARKRRFLCDKEHLLQIQTVHVTKALTEFIERYYFIKREEIPLNMKERLLARKRTVSRNLTEKDVKEFWERYREIFPATKERLWDGLLIGLKQYHEILKERKQLSTETEYLQKQNAELRHLLRTYTNKSENNEATDTADLLYYNNSKR